MSRSPDIDGEETDAANLTRQYTFKSMAMNSSLETRLARREDLDGIGILLQELAGPHYSERFPGATVADFCRWKYFENPMGDAAVGIAVSGKRVVSLVAATPKLIQVGSE